ncbi:MAG: TetR family transcriptional regulator [Burkholderiales bacterium]|nr:TetR family transcriptional regulator [Burkholderiales bacterium]
MRPAEGAAPVPRRGARERAGAARGGNGAARPESRGRDPARTRARILDAATGEFARHGLAGARVDRIAERAGANKRMLYYYFGDKDALFAAVLEHAYRSIRAAEQTLNLLDVEPIEGVRRLVAFTWCYYLEHPEFLALLNSENLHRGRHVRGSRRVRAANSPLVATLGAILRRGERAGAVRPGVDPVQLYISIAGLAYFFLSNNYTLSAVFGRDLATAHARRARLEHMVDVITGYLTASGADRPPRRRRPAFDKPGAAR